ncbi:MAG TPA: NusG domain II-containing protein [Methylomusa anaerophila]|uniref:Uncharacterized protein n=1 Tax=Methylomusa anaerophila TaxID=1930071 RepID=A0A348AFB1_9FIRM|nr:NusG domain II-containing protein [Methylomusa anaerophila]BBB89759.1 hypothetical protein MAMMFC1_00393 [Methylomusa anaerophila]HML89195.1 NusG domain II-containing protein [Methylomusa anaerophila]
MDKIAFKLTRADKWLILCLIVFSTMGIVFNLIFFTANAEQRAEISVAGQWLRTIPLRDGYHEEIRIGGKENYDIIEVDGRKIHVREADCPDQICVKTGWISVPPQQIVCLPYRVVIKIVSAKATEIDDIVR